MIDPVHFEILPFGKGEAEAAELPERVRLTVTCSPKHGLDESIATATRLRALGHSVTLHLAARMVRGRDHLDELLGRMKENGIDDAFVIGGRRDSAARPVHLVGGAAPDHPRAHASARSRSGSAAIRRATR